MRILITGKKSYVGLSLQRWLSQWTDKYIVDTIDVRTDDWKNEDFSKYDVVCHVAALVHKKELPEMKEIYIKVNRDLTIEIAKKAKDEGIKQFIFMSSMAVYGVEGKIGEKVLITKDTIPNPNTFYGISKLEAENELINLEDKYFKVSIIRPPMVYGHRCPGNYSILRKIALITPIFPKVNNQRSMIYINNLSEFIRLLVNNQEAGIFFPQNSDYVSTSEMVQMIAESKGRKIYLSKALAIVIKLLARNSVLTNKVFGNLTYDTSIEMMYSNNSYCMFNLKESIYVES
ncbi:NAD-dependent epimerase/dehydratase family protein [Paenibacillus sp. NPDC056579]|uniref:NAD-dependent epimerase/dehydratase family protein n=1 Tax=Paenibacillus sp. NPDC056579 TaxID=3345871 RepID=UPI003693E2E5